MEEVEEQKGTDKHTDRQRERVGARNVRTRHKGTRAKLQEVRAIGSGALRENGNPPLCTARGSSCLDSSQQSSGSARALASGTVDKDTVQSLGECPDERHIL